ncbi:hypothetical protein TWF751_008942 [Orbilia oligospora]|nr:hypothetical protein TWF751_008942 [Orbilia oligospora]
MPLPSLPSCNCSVAVEASPLSRRRDLERGRGGPNPIELRDFIKGKNHLLKQISSDKFLEHCRVPRLSNTVQCGLVRAAYFSGLWVACSPKYSAPPLGFLCCLKVDPMVSRFGLVEMSLES